MTFVNNSVDIISIHKLQYGVHYRQYPLYPHTTGITQCVCILLLSVK